MDYVDAAGKQSPPQPQRSPDWYWCDDGVSRYWDGTKWVLDIPQDEAEAPRGTSRSEGAGVVVLVGFIVSIVIMLLLAVIGDRLEWAACPGSATGCAPSLSLGDAAAAFLVFGVPAGLLVAGYLNRGKRRGST